MIVFTTSGTADFLPFNNLIVLILRVMRILSENYKICILNTIGKV